MRAILITLVVVLGLADAVAADPFDDGWSAFGKHDHTTAFRLWLPLAEQGDARAQESLGYLFSFASDPSYRSPRLSASWYRKAADQGQAEAQFKLGWMYEAGEGVPQDPVFAHMWFNLAAGQGRGGAQDSRDTLAAKMTSTQIAEAQRLAREWKPLVHKPWWMWWR